MPEPSPSLRPSSADEGMLTAGRAVGAGRYTLVRMLGQGGMGVVWLARDQHLKEEVALKFLPPAIQADAAAWDDLRRETARSHKLTHPHIIRIHDLHEARGEAPFISMEYVDGPTLSGLRLRQAERVLSWEFLRPLVQQLCAALDYAHGEKVIHRDLKPGNLLLAGPAALNDSPRLKLADFGIAATLSDSLSRVSVRHPTGGTLAYMSPQQLTGQRPKVADDIYALGATLYELLTGRPPFYTGDLVLQVREVLPQPLAGRLAELEINNEVPPQVAALVMACLAKDPAQRPQSARAVAEWSGLEARVLSASQPASGPVRSARAEARPRAALLASPVGRKASLWDYCRRALTVTDAFAAVLWAGAVSAAVLFAILGGCHAASRAWKNRIAATPTAAPVRGPKTTPRGPAASPSAPAAEASNPAHVPTFDWAVRVGAVNGWDAVKTPTGLATDRQGRCYLSGLFERDASIEDTNVSRGKANTCFLAGYDGAGNLRWMRRQGGPDVWPSALAVNAAGDCYVAGSFRGRVSFDNRDLVSAVEQREDRREATMFLAKYDGMGNFQWAESPGETSRGSMFHASPTLALDREGACYIGGCLLDTIDLGKKKFYSGKPYRFLGKYDRTGDLQWARAIGSSLGGGFIDAIACDGAGNLYLAGSFFRNESFGTKSLRAPGTAVFVAQCDSTATPRWFQQADVAFGAHAVTSMTTDNNGNCLVAGHSGGVLRSGATNFIVPASIKFGATNLFADAYVAKFSSRGELQWALPLRKDPLPAGGSQTLPMVLVDNEGCVYITGDNLGFVAKYSPSGVELWTKPAPGGAGIRSRRVALDAAGNLLVAGTFQGTVSFDSVTLNSAGTNDIFLAKLQLVGKPRP